MVVVVTAVTVVAVARVAVMARLGVCLHHDFQAVAARSCIALLSRNTASIILMGVYRDLIQSKNFIILPSCVQAQA